MSDPEKRGCTIIPEEEGCLLLYVSTATSLQNKRNLPVLCQGFCVHSTVNSICFKVWGVLQDWNGQVASQDSQINSKSKSLVHSLQSQRPTPTSASFSLHTGINQELESRPQLWKQLQKIHPAFGSCMALQNRFHKLSGSMQGSFTSGL